VGSVACEDRGQVVGRPDVLGDVDEVQQCVHRDVPASGLGAGRVGVKDACHGGHALAVGFLIRSEPAAMALGSGFPGRLAQGLGPHDHALAVGLDQ
jgi:hypothetical protein